MITTGSSSIPLDFRVTIAGVNIDYTSIQRVNIELQENMHNLATLDVAGIPTAALAELIDVPIQIAITVGSVRAYNFFGYIVYSEPESLNKQGLVNKSPLQITKLHCLGSTYTMKSKKTRAWTSRTLPQIVSELSTEYNLSISVPNDKYVFPRVAQAGKSDWELLVELSSYLGYSISVSGTHVDIWDPFTALSRADYIPLYAMAGNNGRVKATPGQVIKMVSTVGAVTPSASRTPDSISALVNNTIATTNLDTGSGYGKTVTSMFENEVALNADSLDMANAILKGRSRKKFPYVAHLDVVGDPLIVPGVMVNLQKYDADIDGLWLVQKVRHEMFRGSAMSYLTVAKDSHASETVSSTTIANPLPDIPVPTLRNGKWISSTELVYSY